MMRYIFITMFLLFQLLSTHRAKCQYKQDSVINQIPQLIKQTTNMQEWQLVS